MSTDQQDKKIRVMIVCDSTGMPREGLPYDHTWISLLRMKYPLLEIIDRPQRGGTTFRLVMEGGGGRDLLELYEPSIVILQTGITDCAPRLFRRDGLEYRFINRCLPKKLLPRYINFIRKHRVRNPLYAYVSLQQFHNNVVSFVKRAVTAKCQIIIIGILPPCSQFTAKSPFADQSIDNYNEILVNIQNEYKNVSVVFPMAGQSEVDRFFMDEIHVNRDGSLMIFNSVDRALKTLI